MQAAIPLSALLLNHEGRYELFLAPGRYATGEVLQFDQLEVVLERLFELSPRFMRYVVSVRSVGKMQSHRPD